MKILEIEITGVRGIPRLQHRMSLKNFAVYGPNGSGKSGLVDSIDFLLTGQVKRLTGQGTGSLSLKSHGPHINHKISDCSVRALVKLDEIAEPIEISRKMSSPQVLNVPEKHASAMAKYIEVAKRGHHVLTRRDLLRFVTAEDSTRATEIQALLNLGDIEGMRKQFLGAQKEISARAKDRQSVSNQKQAAVNAITNASVFEVNDILKLANQQREVLGLKPTTELSKAGLLADFNPSAEQKPKMNAQLACATLEKLRESVSNSADLQKQANELIEKILSLKADPLLLKTYSRLRLTELGLEQLTDESCPLCDEPWNLKQLKDHLQEKLLSAKNIEKHLTEIEGLSTNIKSALLNAQERLETARQNATIAGFDQLAERFRAWTDDVRVHQEYLIKPLDGANSDHLEPKKLASLMAPQDWENLVGSCSDMLKKAFPAEGAEATAREFLSKLALAIEMLDDARQGRERADCAAIQATMVLDGFTKARDRLLEELYRDVAARFAELYKFVNEDDESAFEAELKPDGAGVTMRVAFYGHGMHPPHALHSEGHQDSMGLCLYLALMERLTEGAIGIVVLDDVVMSIDSEHRRKICELLLLHFPNRQLIITTHDRVWANQLKSCGLISSENLLLFSGWDVDDGPHIEKASEVWKRIEVDLKNDQVPPAAARLRRMGEEHFSTVCQDLIASVPCKLDGRWEFGELLQSACSRLKYLLKEGIVAAQSWDQKDLQTRLMDLEKLRVQKARFFINEQGAINQTVHYNQWHQLSSADFRPVVEAFKNLTTAFTCPQCDSLLSVLQEDRKDKNVSCRCGSGGWNLSKKPK